MGLVKQQRNGTTYLYESTSYYDAEKKQSRSKRKLLGKIDEETGELVPTGKRGRKKQDTQAPKSGKKKSEKDSGNPSENSTASDIEKEFSDRIETQEKEIILLKKRIDILEAENEKLRLEHREAIDDRDSMRSCLADIVSEAKALAERANKAMR